MLTAPVAAAPDEESELKLFAKTLFVVPPETDIPLIDGTAPAPAVELRWSVFPVIVPFTAPEKAIPVRKTEPVPALVTLISLVFNVAVVWVVALIPFIVPVFNNKPPVVLRALPVIFNVPCEAAALI